MLRLRTLLALIVCLVMAAIAVGAASAGEITGNGQLKAVNGNSPCAYSGQEDLQWYTDDSDAVARTDPTRGDPSYSQSWGQIVSGAGGHLGGANSVPDAEWGCNAQLYGLK